VVAVAGLRPHLGAAAQRAADAEQDVLRQAGVGLADEGDHPRLAEPARQHARL
jgi:hypothetical protein